MPAPTTDPLTRPTLTDLQRRDHAVVWHPCSQMKDYEAFPPLEIKAAKGCQIELADGRKLYDAISSWWCKSLGHSHPALNAALSAQAEHFEHVIGANTTSEALVRLCERLTALCNESGGTGIGDLGSEQNHQIPTEARAPNPEPRTPHFGKCFFADNGSTGVEVALKMALQAQHQRGQTQRTKLAALSNGYHGETAGAMSVSDLDLYQSPHGSMMFEVAKVTGLPYRVGPDDPAWMDASAEWPEIEKQLDAQADVLAAIIYEPVLQAAGGMSIYSPDLLRRLRQWADTNGVYLVADEIAAGLGRCGGWLASHLANGAEALPDFAVVSKGLTAGYLPMSVVLATDPVYDLFYDDYFSGKAFMHSNTYAGSALGVAVAHAAFDVYEQSDILGYVAETGPLLRQKLHQLAVDRPGLRNVRGVGMTAAVDLFKPDGTAFDPHHRTGYRVYQEAVKRGALLRPLGDVMYLFPPLNVTEPEIHAMGEILGDSIDAVMSEHPELR